MSTLKQIRDNILAKLDDGVVQRPMSAQVDTQINSTIDFYENKIFWFSEKVADLTATAGNRVLGGIPTDFKMLIEPNSLVVLLSDIKYPLYHITPLEYDAIDQNSQGLPRWFTFREGNIELMWIPDQDYDFKLFYRKKYVDLVLDGDTNDFTDNTPRLIEYRTLSDLLFDFREDDVRGGTYSQRAREEFRQIQNETYNRTSTGILLTEDLRDGMHHNHHYH